MTTLTKERRSPQISTEAAKRLAQRSQELEREKSELQDAPDGSGKGKFHETLSFYLRRWAYETTKQAFFYQIGWSGEKRIFKMIEGGRLEGIRNVILENRGIDILAKK